MKIFLTEYQIDDKIYAGFNIFAESLDEAEYVADLHGLTLVGEVVKMDKNDVWTQSNAAFCIANAGASFEDAHKRLHHLMRLLDTDYEIEKITHPSFTDGRCGVISVRGKQCGIIGEINPTILEMNQIWVPLVCFEVELPSIPSLECKIKKTY